MKQCVKCGEEKPLEKFRVCGNYKGKVYRVSTCAKCYNKSRVNYQRNYRINNKEAVNRNKRAYYKKRMDDSITKEHVNKKQVERYPRYAAQRLLKSAKIRAAKKGIDFDLTLNDIVIPEKCPILEIEIFTGTKANYFNSPSLDRIDNSKGYVKDNVKVISSLANTMKNSATLEQLKLFHKNILNYLNS